MANWVPIASTNGAPAGAGVTFMWSANVNSQTARAATTTALDPIVYQSNPAVDGYTAFAGIAKFAISAATATKILAQGAPGVAAYQAACFVNADSIGGAGTLSNAQAVMSIAAPQNLASQGGQLVGAGVREGANVLGGMAGAAGEGLVNGAMGKPPGGDGGTNWALYIVGGIVALIVLVVLLVVGGRALKRI